MRGGCSVGRGSLRSILDTKTAYILTLLPTAHFSLRVFRECGRTLWCELTQGSALQLNSVISVHPTASCSPCQRNMVMVRLCRLFSRPLERLCILETRPLPDSNIVPLSACQDGSSSGTMLPVLQEQAVPEVAV